MSIFPKFYYLSIPNSKVRENVEHNFANDKSVKHN